MSKNISREYRPKNFSQLIGQDNIKKSIQRIVDEDFYSPCYILYGPRGTGKTSVARLFPKLVNCTERNGIISCDKCISCHEFTEDRSFSIVEIDGASYRGVEDMARIKDSALLSTNGNKKKFYIIDEAHMISDTAFNSMLKMLENPPENIVFLLITTEIKKIPDPIFSRCVSLYFSRPPKGSIESKLNNIIKDKKISISDEALSTIINYSDCCVRDAETILESSIICREDDKFISEKDVCNAIGAISVSEIFYLDEIKLSKSEEAATSFVDKLIFSFGSTSKIIDCLAHHFHNHLIYKITGKCSSAFSEYYKSNSNIYDKEELSKILSGILMVEQASQRSKTCSKIWISLFIQKIVSGFYKSDLFIINKFQDIKETSKTLKEDKKSYKLNNRTEQEKISISEFIKIELKDR